MRALILSDIHSNLQAFDAVLADADDAGGYDMVWFLGDLVGYGSDPSVCIDRLRRLPHVAIAGNHDHAVTGKLNPDLFNGAARAAALWTAQQLSDDEIAYLAALPEVRQTEKFTHVHGSLRDPVMEYLISEPAALATFALMETPFCLVGHSHYPLVWTEEDGRAGVELLDPATPLLLESGRRMIVNPGSVGQPRDGDWRASYLLYESEAGGKAGMLHHRRVEYDLAGAQNGILSAGLPESLAIRLGNGH
ncbi:MAG: metallophosphoesterase family protein [Chloroflexota bacterium]|nr:metallophosphoesterase family protein [Chloroflexota bacterium]MDE2959411.1 metallophosphoesterase family protein [Chloroflexota bacterium]